MSRQSRLDSFQQSITRDGGQYDPRYYCLKTIGTRFDAVAAASLQSFGMEVLHLRIKETVRDRNNRVYVSHSALFPGYLIARFDLRYFRSLGYVHGVASVVGLTGFEEIAPEVVEEIQSRIGPDGYVRLDKPRPAGGGEFNDGDKVVFVDGPFRGFTGVFVEGMSAEERITILLDNAHGFMPHVQVSRQAVAAVAAHHQESL